MHKHKSMQCCNHCKDSRAQVLQFHHLDPKKKDIKLSLAANNGWSIKRIQQEINKCVVLCANCHIMEHVRIRQETQ